ncbi:SDR family oxidoreductase [Aquincola sp. S2]|uniref:SDR family oxidoreductase n=1 Tax=Pseudaquabacterium terrae TaxID=2732868 RepID=A0ABX2EHS7_9BURK|nr:SDR family oxidoreductase [Aquabacterium terrae]NRF68174.1 SDR family oxidoreductase [Aquabacterium terrae]
MATTDKPRRDTVLITGASGGIGEAIAHCAAADGCALVLVARSADKLQALADELGAEHGVPVRVLPADLGRPGAAAALVAELKRRRISVDVLVNNAGILENAPFAETKAERHQALIDLNIGALTGLLAELLPPMVKRGHGRVLNVASIAAFQPVPTLATYAATKAFVLSLTESLAEELAGSGVTITALCPGITATGMLSSAVEGNPTLARLPSFVVGDVMRVARDGWRACQRGQVIKVPGAANLAATIGGRATPKWLLRRIAGAATRWAK